MIGILEIQESPTFRFFDWFKQGKVGQFLVWFNVFKCLLFLSSQYCQ